MKAVLCRRYGSPEVLEIADIAKPEPGKNDILIQVHASTVNSGDCRIRGFVCPPWAYVPMRLILGITKPRRPVLGMSFSGVVAAVGTDVTRFKVGDAIYGSTGMKQGAYAEYLCLPQNAVLAHKPTNLSHEEAVALPFGGMTAIDFLAFNGSQEGKSILVYGASGAVGTMVVQLAKNAGMQVTAVCSGANRELVKGLGATTVIDYTTEDFAETKQSFDLIFDAVGKISRSQCRPILKPGGKFLTVAGAKVAKEKSAYLEALKQLAEAGKIKAVVDKVYPLEQIVAAHAYADKGHKKGNVVIKVL